MGPFVDTETQAIAGTCEVQGWELPVERGGGLERWRETSGPPGSGAEMKKSRITNQVGDGIPSGGLARVESRATTIEEKPRGRKGWLFGAYTFLLLWGLAFLVLLFTNRLPF